MHAVEEACGFGWRFHEQLGEAGAASSVIAPQEINGKRKTDNRDARTLATLLWDYSVRGNKQCLRVVRAPTQGEQQRRGYSRNRSQWRGLRAQIEAQGRSLMWDHSWLSVPKGWWQTRIWSKLAAELKGAGEHWLVTMLTPMQNTCVQLQKRVDELEDQAVAHSRPMIARPVKQATKSQVSGSEARAGQAPKEAGKALAARVLPMGFGELSYETLNAEVMDWSRFKNRGQAGSFIGCCPSEHSSGGRQKLGEIDRIGSARLRTLLVEAAWRLVKWNPQWRGFKKFGEVLTGGAKVSGARKRKAIVACARLLMVDMWRLHTGAATLAGLGLVAAKN